VNGKVSGARFSDDKPVAILVHGPTNCDGSSWVASPPGIPVSGQDRLSVAVLQSDAVRGLFGPIAADRHAAPPSRPPPPMVGKYQRAGVSLARFDVGEIFLAHELGQRFADRQQEGLKRAPAPYFSYLQAIATALAMS